MTDKLSDFEAFVAIVEQKTLSGAARSLDCSPSAMSKSVTRLENRLGVRLLNRTSRSLSLTPDGEVFYLQACTALEAVRHAEEVVSSKTGDVTGTLRIATSLQISQFYLAPLVPALRELHPRLELQFFLRPHGVHLIEHQIDIAIFGGDPPSSSYIARRLAPVRWVVCGAPSYLQRAGKPIHPRELAEHDCMNFLPGEEVAWHFIVEGAPYAITPIGGIRANSGDLLRVFATLGQGIARVPIDQIRTELDTGALVLLLEEFEADAPEWLYAIYPSARNLSPRAIAFLQFLDSSFRRPAGKA